MLTHLFIWEYLCWNFKFLYFTYQSSNCGIKMVLDWIVCTPRNILWYFSPFISMYFMSFNEYKFFIFIPLTFSDFRIKMVMPSFSALLAISIWRCCPWSDFICNDIPSFSPELFNEDTNENIFLCLPMLTLFSPVITEILEHNVFNFKFIKFYK